MNSILIELIMKKKTRWKAFLVAVHLPFQCNFGKTCRRLFAIGYVVSGAMCTQEEILILVKFSDASTYILSRYKEFHTKEWPTWRDCREYSFYSFYHVKTLRVLNMTRLIALLDFFHWIMQDVTLCNSVYRVTLIEIKWLNVAFGINKNTLK